MTVEDLLQCAKDRKEWRALVHVEVSDLFFNLLLCSTRHHT